MKRGRGKSHLSAYRGMHFQYLEVLRKYSIFKTRIATKNR